MDARRLALDLGRPVVFEANVRLHRWRSGDEAADAARACLPGALLVRANRAEAQLMTGESDPERAARAIAGAGAELVVLTLGADGAILRGVLELDVPAVPCRVQNTAGAGDVLTGTLLAALARDRFAPAASGRAARRGGGSGARLRTLGSR